MARFDRRVAITGAGSGIGTEVVEIVQRSAAEGATPVIADLNVDATNVAAEIKSNGGRAVAMDVSAEDQVKKGVADSVAKCGKLDRIAKQPSDPECILLAHERLRRAELQVEHLRGLLSELEPSHNLVLTWLKESERAVFSRRFELEALLKERRQATSAVGVSGTSELSEHRRALAHPGQTMPRGLDG